VNARLESQAAPAKLNLFLHVVGRRDDGYHLLESVFQLIDIADSLDFGFRTDGLLQLTGDDCGVPAHDNLVIRAARLLQDEALRSGHAMLGADIHLRKQIPTGGGLGGGSSDAATTLMALNTLWKLDLCPAQLARIGLQLGADVPFFLGGGNAWVQGVGEQLTPMDLPERWFLVLHPGVGVSTPAIFRSTDLTRNSPHAIMSDFAQAWSDGQFFGRNDLQAVAVKQEHAVAQALQILPNSRMTGSGSCVFAVFDSQHAATQASEKLNLPSSMRVWVCRGLSRHPFIKSTATP
jgi:4-diphosphocytidyl-2-C-methyl-D-erythritol kinase